MSEPHREPAAAVPAATLLLLRDGSSGLEVFMLERRPGDDVVPGAMVFPGGKVEAGDADPRLRRRCAGVAGLADEAVALRAAAIREAFEECGVLLARARGATELISAERLRALDSRGPEPLGELVEREDLELACDLLVPFAHWVTPTPLPRRFDTHFFAVAAPSHHVAVHDGGEAVGSTWIPPARALEEEREGRLTIIFPTLMNLGKLGRSASVAAALETASREPIVTVQPRIERGERGLVLRIPAEAGYGVVEAPVDALRTPPGTAGTRR
ncbi:MAG: NUDIX hydrolase [Myxococcota bacterium]